jgi:hypothetical protein
VIRPSISDSEVNISEEDLCEWFDPKINSGERHIIYKSFKPGLVSDFRIIPQT